MTQNEVQILIVEDDTEIAELVTSNLKKFGFQTVWAADGVEMFQVLESKKIDIVLLDVMLPGEDGWSLCRRLRGSSSGWKSVPVIFLTALGDLTDRVVGLELGADDYLTKPFEMRELVARIRAVLRRSTALESKEAEEVEESPGIWSFGNWRLNVGARHLIDENDTIIPLSAMEFKLLMYFLSHPQKLLTREAILAHMSNREDYFDRSIDVKISRLRSKLRDREQSAPLIRTMRGDGYMFAETVRKS